jgi:hypothetical protein
MNSQNESTQDPEPWSLWRRFATVALLQLNYRRKPQRPVVETEPYQITTPLVTKNEQSDFDNAP